MIHKCNTNCPNKNCEGGIITFDGSSGRICKKCNPTEKVKKIKVAVVGTFVHVADEAECKKRFSHYPKLRVFEVTGTSHNYAWLNSMSMGIEHKYLSTPTRQQIADYMNSITKVEKRRAEALRISKEKVTVTVTKELTVEQLIKLLKTT